MEPKKKFSSHWKRSTQPRKQRKYAFLAPLHHKQKLLQAHLSSELRKKYARRSMQVKKGDTIKVMRGQFSKKTGKVERVNLKRGLVFVQGVEYTKKDGGKIPAPLKPSNLLLTALETGDKKRKMKLEIHQSQGKIPSKETQKQEAMSK